MVKELSFLPEFSRLVSVEKVAPSGQIEVIEANPNERVALAERFGLLDLSKLSAKLYIQPSSKYSGFNVTGTMNVEAAQQCVVSLDPIPTSFECAVDVLFLPPDEDPPIEKSYDLTPDMMESEVILDGKMDLGELLAQRLFLSLDPYPRKPGLAPLEVEFGGQDKATNPFSLLKDKPK